MRKVAYSVAPPRQIVGDAKPHLVTEVTFDSMEAVDRALQSPEGQPAAADLANFAQAGVAVFCYDVRREPVFEGED